METLKMENEFYVGDFLDEICSITPKERKLLLERLQNGDLTITPNFVGDEVVSYDLMEK